MRCPFCAAEKESLKVIDSRTCEGGRAIRRRRVCDPEMGGCGKRFTTYERVEQTTRMMVVKKDGRRVPFDKAKILAGLERACFKLTVEESELLRIADEVEEEVTTAYDREIPSTAIGQMVIERLRRVDQVAYVRFASVYRQFKTLDDLVEEAKAVIDARRYEDPPGQGRLFIEPSGPVRQGAPAGHGAAGAANGAGGNGAPGEAPTPRGRRKRQPVEVPPATSTTPQAE